LEFGGLNLFGFVDNSPVNSIDPVGYAAYLSYKELSKDPGDCGAFTWEIEWHVNIGKGKKSPEAPSGWIFQKVEQHEEFYDDNNPSISYVIQPDPTIVYEGWFWPGLAVHFPKDKWALVAKGGAALPKKGNVKFTATAYYVNSTPDANLWKPSPSGSGTADIFIPSPPSANVSEPNPDSNKVTRTLAAEWDCTTHSCKTKLKTTMTAK
jgi:hypothetical protein